MQNLNQTEMMNISGGLSISGTLISSVSKAISTIFGIGEYLGSAIRRITKGKLCPM